MIPTDILEFMDMLNDVRTAAYKQGLEDGLGRAEERDDTYEFGHADGYDEGLTDGREEGYSEGFTAGAMDAERRFQKDLASEIELDEAELREPQVNAHHEAFSYEPFFGGPVNAGGIPRFVIVG